MIQSPTFHPGSIHEGSLGSQHVSKGIIVLSVNHIESEHTGFDF